MDVSPPAKKTRWLDRLVRIEMLLATTMLWMAGVLYASLDYFDRVPALKYLVDHHISPRVFIAFCAVAGFGQLVANLTDHFRARVLLAFISLLGWGGLGWVSLATSPSLLLFAFMGPYAVFSFLVVIRNKLSDEARHRRRQGDV